MALGIGEAASVVTTPVQPVEACKFEQARKGMVRSRRNARRVARYFRRKSVGHPGSDEAILRYCVKAEKSISV